MTPAVSEEVFAAFKKASTAAILRRATCDEADRAGLVAAIAVFVEKEQEESQ